MNEGGKDAPPAYPNIAASAPAADQPSVASNPNIKYVDQNGMYNIIHILVMY